MALPVLAIRAIGEGPSDPGDFVFLFILVAGVGAAFEIAARVSDRHAYRTGVVIALAAALLSVWINSAVGIIGSEDNPANWIYAAPIAVAAIGSVLARFRPTGMARSMVAAAIAQVLAFAFALLAGLGFTGPITIFFAGLWLIAAWLFRKAARDRARASRRR
jgi:peptidoglycan/LPS O-acetylase OafA/YrhL